MTIIDPNWKDEKVDAYIIYEKTTGKVWSIHTSREGRDEEYRSNRKEFPTIKLGKLKRVTTRAHLLDKVKRK